MPLTSVLRGLNVITSLECRIVGRITFIDPKFKHALYRVSGPGNYANDCYLKNKFDFQVCTKPL
jgi:hypothetical protein